MKRVEIERLSEKVRDKDKRLEPLPRMRDEGERECVM